MRVQVLQSQAMKAEDIQADLAGSYYKVCIPSIVAAITAILFPVPCACSSACCTCHCPFLVETLPQASHSSNMLDPLVTAQHVVPSQPSPHHPAAGPLHSCPRPGRIPQGVPESRGGIREPQGPGLTRGPGLQGGHQQGKRGVGCVGLGRPWLGHASCTTNQAQVPWGLTCIRRKAMYRRVYCRVCLVTFPAPALTFLDSACRLLVAGPGGDQPPLP
jgi:hypothetical protein